MVATHPNIPPLDVMKEVGRLWQVITKDHLRKFQILSADDHNRYQREYNHYMNELSLQKEKTKASKKKQGEDVLKKVGKVSNESSLISSRSGGTK